MYNNIIVKTFDNFESIVASSHTLTEIAFHYGMPTNGKTYIRLRKEIEKQNLDASHIKMKKNLLDKITDDDFSNLLQSCGSISEFCKKADINYTFYNKKIKERAVLLGVNFEQGLRPDRWSKSELKILTDYYESIRPRDLIKLLPDKSVDAIKLKASALGLNSPFSSEFLSNIGVLLNDISESYYWMGFILADGHISEDNRLTVTLHKRDKKHLRKLAEYIQAEHKERAGNSETKVSFAVKNQKILPLIKEKFDINNQKTYNPPSNSLYADVDISLLTCLLCGFIDGDGHIKKQTNRQDALISIQIHGSWLKWLEVLYGRLCQVFPETSVSRPKLNKRGYASWVIANHIVVNYLKQTAIENNLPILERKWSKIN